ncbi:MAG: hypothetical protein HDR15_08610 [Lachnospiraceae bacterium]|nr:hypothetical protein [Lachnospiraceae bacterium]
MQLTGSEYERRKGAEAMKDIANSYHMSNGSSFRKGDKKNYSPITELLSKRKTNR